MGCAFATRIKALTRRNALGLIILPDRIDAALEANPALLRDPGHLLALGFGSGLLPIAPGTWGTLVAVPLYWWFIDLSLVTYMLLITALASAGVWLCGRTAQALGAHDHPAIVWDEVVGFLLAMIAVPFEWAWLAVGFLLFRLLDIAKPWPIKQLDRQVPGGFGIMLDDLVAGVYTALILHGIVYWFG